jgi:hypothetical protein
MKTTRLDSVTKIFCSKSLFLFFITYILYKKSNKILWLKP